MTHFLVLLLALLIGVVAGLRALTAPAVVAWAAMLDWINLDGTWAEWVGHPITVAVLTVLAIAELVTDQLPKTPSRKVPLQFGARIVSGGLCGAAIGAWRFTFAGLVAGVVGAVIGTLGGAGRRARWRPTSAATADALIEDGVAVLGGAALAALASVV